MTKKDLSTFDPSNVSFSNATGNHPRQNNFRNRLPPENLGSLIDESLNSSPEWKSILGTANSEKSSVDSIELLISLLTPTTQHSFSKEEPQSKDHVSSDYNIEEAIYILFGNPFQVTAKELNSWCSSRFRFATSIKDFTIGLLQEHNGPCGVLVPLQCWMIIYILFSIWKQSKISQSDSSFNIVNSASPTQINRNSVSKDQATLLNANIRSHTEEPFITTDKTFDDEMFSSKTPFVVSQNQFRKALAWAMTICLYRCTTKSHYILVTFLERPRFNNLPPSSSAFLANSVYRIDIYHSIAKVYYRYMQLLQEDTPTELLGFLISLVMTRTHIKIKNDMDDAMFALIGTYGHSTQELVNLLLTGEAVSNVFDGNRKLASDFPELKGIQRQQIIGYLTQLEATGYCEVGNYYKCPLLPLWVIGSSNHFTTLASWDPRMCVQSKFDRIYEKLSGRFDSLDPESVGVISAALLDHLLSLCDLTKHFNEARQVLDPPGQGGVILKYNFVEWGISKLMEKNNEAQPANTNRTSHITRPTLFVLYHYDGQVPPAPTLVTVLLEPVDFAGAVGDNDVGGSDLGTILRTKWKNAAITII